MNNRYRFRLVEIIGTAVLLLGISTGSAHAYIDPGTGSYVLQVVLASILAAAFVVKSTWRSIKEAVARRFGKRVKDEE